MSELHFPELPEGRKNNFYEECAYYGQRRSKKALRSTYEPYKRAIESWKPGDEFLAAKQYHDSSQALQDYFLLPPIVSTFDDHNSSTTAVNNEMGHSFFHPMFGLSSPPRRARIEARRVKQKRGNKGRDMPDGAIEIEKAQTSKMSASYLDVTGSKVSRCRDTELDRQTPSHSEYAILLNQPRKSVSLQDQSSENNARLNARSTSTSSMLKKNDQSDNIAPAQAQLFACPFYKNRPRMYQECSKPMLRSISALRQHLARKHRAPQYHCPICFEEFRDSNNQKDHIRRKGCSEKSSPFEELIDEHVWRAISRKKPASMTDEAHWFKIYGMLFPKVDLPNSPYTDSENSVWEDVMRRIFHTLDYHTAYGIQAMLTDHSASDLPPMLQDITNQAWQSYSAGHISQGISNPHRNH